MTIWAIADLHLAISVPNKTMEIFGPQWEHYIARLEENWKNLVSEDDLVLLAGDITWAMKQEEAKIDLEWIDTLPGTKVMIRGNHDYWWESMAKVKKICPPSIHPIHNNSFLWHDIAIGGTRLWDTPEYSFENETLSEAEMKNYSPPSDSALEQEAKIFTRELHRLELSLKTLPKEARVRIAMTHYPPIGVDLAPSQTSLVLEQHDIDICVFGHLHNVKPGTLPFGEARGVRYILTACDYLECCPLKIL